MPVIVYWHWWIIALLLAILEVFAPGVLFIWLAIAALVVGGSLFILPAFGWEGQLVLFSVVSIVALTGSRYYLKRTPIATDQPLLNRRGEAHVGRVYPLMEPLVNGRGAVRVADSRWAVESETDALPACTR